MSNIFYGQVGQIFYEQVVLYFVGFKWLVDILINIFLYFFINFKMGGERAG